MSTDAIKYLLGQLPEDERERLERTYFSSADDFETTLANEDELFFDYVLDRLAPADGAPLEQRFLATPDGRQEPEPADARMQPVRHQTAHGLTRAPEASAASPRGSAVDSSSGARRRGGAARGVHRGSPAT